MWSWRLRTFVQRSTGILPVIGSKDSADAPATDPDQAAYGRKKNRPDKCVPASCIGINFAVAPAYGNDDASAYSNSDQQGPHSPARSYVQREDQQNVQPVDH